VLHAGVDLSLLKVIGINTGVAIRAFIPIFSLKKFGFTVKKQIKID